MDCDTDDRSSRGGRNNRIRHQGKKTPSQNDDRLSKEGRNNRIRHQGGKPPSQNDDWTNVRSNNRHNDTSNTAVRFISERDEHRELPTLNKDPAIRFSGECDTCFSNSSGVFLSAESDRELPILHCTYQSRTNNHYSTWRNIYDSYLWTLYNLMKTTLNSLKVFVDKKIDFDDFVNFAYTHSSGYISPYT